MYIGEFINMNLSIVIFNEQFGQCNITFESRLRNALKKITFYFYDIHKKSRPCM